MNHVINKKEIMTTLKINKKKIEIYDLDTPESITLRIANLFNTLPKYIYFSKPIGDIIKSGKGEAEDLLKIILDDAKDNEDFTSLLKKIEGKYSGLNVKTDILNVWLTFNKSIKNIEDSPMILKAFQQSLEDYYPDEETFLRFWKEKDSISSNLKNQLKDIAAKDEKNILLYKKFNMADEDSKDYSTNFIVDKVSIRIDLDLKETTILDLFNDVLLNENVPFVTCKDYWKIKENFIPQEDWLKNNQRCSHMNCKNNVVFMKRVSLKEYADETMLKYFCNEHTVIGAKNINDQLKMKVKNSDTSYTTVFIDIDDFESTVLFDLEIKRGNIDVENFKDRIFSVFETPKKILKTKETEIAGVFYFLGLRMNTYVFSDLVMNNSLFSSLISIDESLKATKKKAESTQPWLHILFNHPKTGRITAGIYQLNSDGSDPNLKEYENENVIDRGDPYIRIRVNGRDDKSITLFKGMMSKYFDLYNENWEEIVNFYKQYIPDFGNVGEDSDIKETKKKKTSQVAPGVYIEGYSRYCPVDRMPIVLNEKEARDNENVMVFPREKKDWKIPFPSDGAKKRYYTCTNPDYPYPGLRENILKNKDEYPYVPCCFKINQKEKKGSLYRKYFFEEEIHRAKDKKQQDLILTNKILDADVYGKLPSELRNFFDVLDSSSESEYLRHGVPRNKDSFLKCIEKSIDKKISREKLSKPEVAVLAKQCLYDMDVSQISKNILNPDVYLDPKKYVQLIETYLDCNIILFDSRGLIFPRSLQGYYNSEKKGKYILIYEHFGSEADKAEYPQCEIIGKWNKRDNVYLLNFESDDKIIRELKKIISESRKEWTLTDIIDNVVFNLNKVESGIQGQVIDYYGKTRRVDVIWNKDKITLLTSPIAPLQVEEISGDINVNLVSPNVCLKFMKDIGGRLLYKTLDIGDENRCLELNFLVGNVLVNVPIDGSKVDLKIEKRYKLHYILEKSDTSAIQTYNRNKRIARYITEYIIWLFSNWLYEKEITDDSKLKDSIFEKFINSSLVVNPDFKYSDGEIPITFSKESPLMYKKKLVLNSPELLKRIVYVLKLYSKSDPKNFFSYRERTRISQYYLDITDFDVKKGQVILQGSEIVERWIFENKSEYELYDEIQEGTAPYFMNVSGANSGFPSGNIFLAQNTSSLESALEVASMWEKESYNIGYFGTLEKLSKKEKKKLREKYSFTLVQYQDKKNIKKFNVNGKGGEKLKSIVVGRMRLDEPSYTVLLEV